MHYAKQIENEYKWRDVTRKIEPKFIAEQCERKQKTSERKFK